MKPKLTLEILKVEAQKFAKVKSAHWEPSLYGVTDGKAVGTYFEHKFRSYLREKYDFKEGSSASGIDFPELEVDIRQPQSSCPFKSAWQKIYGLGYSLLVFVYEKADDPQTATGNLNVLHTIFVSKEWTADFQTTTGLHRILENDGNKDDILAFIEERRLPVDEIEASAISNALQWRLQYGRIIEKAGLVTGVERLG
jgi:hypothetical protein